ncbi:MAG TPA: OAM dimerization domain-containing protein [bacterium]|nr:OAM dimerization domain-containing protein [bacterium]
MDAHLPKITGEGGIKGPDPKALKPYGDMWDDGLLQISFCLPMEAGPEAREAATQYLQKHGFKKIGIAEMARAAEGFSFFVAYVQSPVTIDVTRIKVPKVETPRLDFDGVNALLKEKLGRKMVVVGACTGADAHTVGIDAIMNMKGYAGDYGLERYPEIDAYNLGAQVENKQLVKKAVELHADAILVSQIITQHDIHVENLKDLMHELEKAGLKEKVIVVAGGPRVTHRLAVELGFDAGFGRGAVPSEVASYLAQELIHRHEAAKKDKDKKK